MIEPVEISRAWPIVTRRSTVAAADAGPALLVPQLGTSLDKLDHRQLDQRSGSTAGSRARAPDRLGRCDLPLSVRTITADEHLAFLRTQRSASFLQTPAWGEVKSEWRRESLGWFAGDDLVGVGLVLYRQLPKVKRYLAYLPEGPVIDWTSERLADWLTPMAAHLSAGRRLRRPDGPAGGHPPLGRPTAVKAGVADDSVRPAGRRAPDRAVPGRRPRGLPAPGARLAAAAGRGRLRRRPAAVQLRDPAAPPRRRAGRPAAQRGRRAQGHEPAVAPQHQEGREGRRRGHPGQRPRT